MVPAVVLIFNVQLALNSVLEITMTFAQKWLRWGSIVGHRIAYNGVGVLRGQRHIPSKTWPKYPPPPRGVYSVPFQRYYTMTYWHTYKIYKILEEVSKSAWSFNNNAANRWWINIKIKGKWASIQKYLPHNKLLIYVKRPTHHQKPNIADHSATWMKILKNSQMMELN